MCSVSLLRPLHSGSLVAGHSRKHSQASLVLGPPAGCVEWFPCRRRPDESPVDQWRRRHRKGHALAEQFGLDLPQLCLLQKHRFAGHVARLKPDSLAHRTLTTRDLAWWRHAQAAHARLKDKWRGVHSTRINVWRWKHLGNSFYGRVFREPHAEATSVGNEYWFSRVQ